MTDQIQTDKNLKIVIAIKYNVTWDEKKILVGKGRNFHGRPFSERPFSVEAGSRALSRFYPLHLHQQMHGVRR